MYQAKKVQSMMGWFAPTYIKEIAKILGIMPTTVIGLLVLLQLYSYLNNLQVVVVIANNGFGE